MVLGRFQTIYLAGIGSRRGWPRFLDGARPPLSANSKDTIAQQTPHGPGQDRLRKHVLHGVLTFFIILRILFISDIILGLRCA